MRAAALALLLALYGIALAAPPVPSSQVSPAGAVQPVSIAGAYHLDGVMETGSDLLLRGDGTFDWAFTYGALDLMAKGRWQREGDGIVLQVKDMAYPPQLPQTRFERMHLRLDGADLVPRWPWDMDDFRKDAERGVYTHDE